MIRVRVRPTNRRLSGYDTETGKVVTRRLYLGTDGEEYVRLGRYISSMPSGYVTRQWFSDHVLRNGMVERGETK